MQPQKGKVSERLLKHCKTQEERDEFTRAYQRAKRVLTELNDYYQRETERMSDLIDSPKGFETPNWQYLQAYYAGYRKAMRIASDTTRI